EPITERAEPVQPLGVRDRRIRGRGRREHEEPDVVDRPLLRPELRALAERTAVGLLADERDRPRPELEPEGLEPLGRALEVAAAKISRSRRRAQSRVRDPVAVVEELELLLRRELSRREPGVVEQAPEVVARIREVRAGS